MKARSEKGVTIGLLDVAIDVRAARTTLGQDDRRVGGDGRLSGLSFAAGDGDAALRSSGRTSLMRHAAERERLIRAFGDTGATTDA